MSDRVSDPQPIFESWLCRLAEAVEQDPSRAAEELFEPDAYWRDVLATTWGLHTFYGREQIAKAFRVYVGDAKIRGAAPSRVSPARRVTRAGRDVIEALFEFETRWGQGRGVVRLAEPVPGSGQVLAWTLMTSLDQLTGFEEPIGSRRPVLTSHARDFGGPNWLDRRKAEALYDDNEPEVVIVGAGQAGLAVAARLRQLGVGTLIVDREARVGDNWRRRYHGLVLHNEVWANHLPYMPFPETWPVYIPKDLLADWFESYAEFMELNVWTETEFEGASYDDETQTWTVSVTRGGERRVLKPRHIVLATGVSGVPYLPALTGFDAYRGEVFHTSAFDDGARLQGKRVVVVGTGTSGHDVAQDLWSNGAEVTMIQRSPTTVVNVGPNAAGRVYGLYLEGHPLEASDLINIATPYPVLRRTYQLLTRELAKQEAGLRDGLVRIGFRLDDGEDATGFQMKYLRRGGGYYLNVGCSELLIRGDVKLLQYEEISHFVPDGMCLRDGTHKAVDAVVLATGYLGQQEFVRRLFGDEVAGKVGPIWGYDDEGELRNMWCRTGQDGLWFTAGSLAQCRIYSKYLALQIKAIEVGLLPRAHQTPGPAGALRDVDLVDA
jgi:cation diffusion facilitator CzcD-associated flavoprotein CzcO